MLSERYRPQVGTVVRRVRAVLGIPRRHDRPASPVISAGVIGATMIAAWLVSEGLGGPAIVPPHIFYIPVGMAAVRFRIPGAVIAGLVAGILAGPLLPLRTATGTEQEPLEWMARTVFFMGIGAFVAWLVEMYRDAATELRMSRAVASALMGSTDEGASVVSSRAGRKSVVSAALEPGAMNIVLQPIVRLDSGRAVGYEALARFALEPKRPPNEWFAEAWAVGRGVELEMAAMRSALRLLPRIPTGYLSVNLSPGTALSDLFRSAIPALPADRLVIEMTEHVPVADYDALAEVLEQMRARGVRFAVDDTGAGYASFRHVLRLNPDVIKLDTGLVRNLDANPLLGSITRALVAFGAESGAHVVAEGVETEEEADALRALGATFAQGYLFSRPKPIEELFFDQTAE